MLDVERHIEDPFLTVQARNVMSTLHNSVMDALAQLEQQAKEEGLDAEQTEKLLQGKYEEMVTVVATSVRADLEEKAPDMLKFEKAQARAFEVRNRRRWKLPLDQLRVMIKIIEETAQLLSEEGDTEATASPHLFNALNSLCARALLLTREILCLIEGGFADGALGRWRTLHEAAVIAVFLAGHDDLTAERYLTSFQFASRRAMDQLNEVAERANLEPFSEEELQTASNACNSAKERLGDGLGEDYGWAREALGKSKRDRVKLADLEVSTGLDHWGPRVRWSSQNVHGAYRPPLASLGMSEARTEVLLAGQSNSGMVDPINMTAISLQLVATSFLTIWPNTDRLVAMRITGAICDEIGHVALAVERKSAARAAARGH